MLWTIATILFYVVVGAGVVLAAVFGMAWFVAREINAGHEPSCQCPTCQGRRLRQYRAQHPASRINPQQPPRQWHKDRKLPTSGRWVSTLDLRVGTQVVAGSGTIYRVLEVNLPNPPTKSMYLVVLVNELTRKQSRVPVEPSGAHKPIWLVRIPRGTVE